MPPQRTTYLSKHFLAGCSVCNDGLAQWFSVNAQAVAAKHHDATGHETWCDVTLSYSYGAPRTPKK